MIKQAKNVLAEFQADLLEENKDCLLFSLPLFEGKFALKKNENTWIISDEGYAYLFLASRGFKLYQVEKRLSALISSSKINDRDGELTVKIDGDFRKSLSLFAKKLKQIKGAPTA